MAREPTHDLAELTRHAFELAIRHDITELMRLYAPDAVLDLSDPGIGTFEGVPAISAFLEEWWDTWVEHVIEVEEIRELGRGVVFASTREDGRLAETDSHVQQRLGWVFVWVDALVESFTAYLDIAAGRAAAERVVASMGW
jgi:ketosteroid isomerase-like protein